MLVLTRGLPLIVMVMFLIDNQEIYLKWSLGISTFVITYEVFHVALDPVQYFKLSYRWIDLIGHICAIIWITSTLHLYAEHDESYLHFKDRYAFIETFIQIVWTFTVTIRASDLFKLFDKTRMLLSIIFVSIEDVMSFTIITIYMLFSIGVVTNLIKYPDNENIVFTTANLFAYSMGAEFDAPPTGENYIPGEWTVFVILKFIIDIVVFNTLIAILGDSFDQVKMD